MNEHHQKQHMPILFAYLRQNPGLALSVSYALLTLCGILYSASFYHEFNISILKLANISDLLIFGFSEPAALLMFAVGLLVAWSADKMSAYALTARDKWRQKSKSLKRSLMMAILYSPKKIEYIFLMIIIIFIMYAYLFVSAFAKWHSKRIKAGHGEQVLVNSQAAGKQASPMMLLGSTNGFLFVYDQLNKQSVMIPIENIDKIQIPVEETKK